MSNFSFDELAKKDFFACIGVWITLEIVCFFLFPTLRFIRPGEKLQTWFLLSIPLGIGGAFLVGASSRFVANVNERELKDKGFKMLLGQIAGWIGLLGVVYPLLMISIEFFRVMLTFDSQY